MTMEMTEYAQRPKRAWQADGLADMATGSSLLCLALLLLYGIYTLLAIEAHKGSPAPYGLNLLITSALQMLVVVPFLLVEPLKRRFVYPRSGYMHLRVGPKKQRLLHGIVVAVVAITLTMVSDTQLTRFWTTNMTLLCVEAGVGLALIVNYVKFGFVRHLVVAVISVATSATLVMTPLDWQHKFLILSIVVGVSLLVGGTVPFLQLIGTPLPTEPDVE